MSNVREIRQRLHDVNGSVSAIDTFVRRVDVASLTDRLKDLHQAALRSLDRLKSDLISLHDAVQLLERE